MKKRAKKTEDWYDERYYQLQGYGFAATEREDHKRIVELIKAKKTDRVLEIGAGLGILLQMIPAKKKVGTETNDYAIKEGKRRGVEMVKNDAEKGLKFKNNSFDTVILNEVIEHFKKPKPVIKECYRILSRGGKIIITTPNKNFFAHDLTESHFSEMTLKELRNLVEECGFKIITQEVNGISFLYPILEYGFYKPFRMLRYKLVKDRTGGATIDSIDSCHAVADRTILKPINRYRNFLLGLGNQQLVLAQKR